MADTGRRGRHLGLPLPSLAGEPATDADGWASIPVGADIDRTLLQLRATAPGLASPLFNAPQGELPEGQSLVMEPTVRISGSAEGADGEPLDSGRVFLTAAKAKSDAKENGDSPSLLGSLGNVRTDANGKWQADVNPADLANLHAFVGQPGGNPVKHTVGAPVDAAAANAGKAVVTSKPH